MLVNLLRLAILAQQTAQNAHSTNPDDLGGETCFAGTTTLTRSGMATLTLGSQSLVHSRTRVNGVRLANDVTILDQFAEVLTCDCTDRALEWERPNNSSGRLRATRTRVRVRDLSDFVWVQPHLTLAALQYGSGQPLLQLQRHHLRTPRTSRPYSKRNKRSQALFCEQTRQDSNTTDTDNSQNRLPERCKRRTPQQPRSKFLHSNRTRPENNRPV